MKRVLLCAVAAIALSVPVASFAATTPLIDAINAGDTAAARGLINAQSAGVADDLGTTPLVMAAAKGNADVVKALLAAGVNATAPSPLGVLAIDEALKSGNGATVAALLDAGADVERLTADGVSSLMIQSRLGNADVVKVLLDHGADVNRKVNDQTALMWASDSRAPAVVRLLIAKGADVNATMPFTPVPLRVSTEPRVRHVEGGSGWSGLSVLHIAARSGCVDCARALVEAGANVDAMEADSITPLITATLNANWDTAKYLVEAGADIDHFDWWGRNALYAVIDYNTIPKGGRADRPSLDETRPLELAEMMLQRGANPNQQLKYIPPYRQSGSDRGADLSLAAGATPLARAAKAADVEGVKLLLKYGADPNIPTWRAWRDEVSGLTPLLQAAGNGHELDDTRGKDRTQAGQIEVIKTLLATGQVDLNFQDPRGRTALFGAVYMGYDDVLKFLLESGADPHIKDLDGVTVFTLAERGQDVFRGQQVQVNETSKEILAAYASPAGAVQGAAR